MPEITFKRPSVDPQPVSSQIDWSGALEVTFEYRGSPGYAWPILLTYGPNTLKRTSSREIRDYAQQSYVSSQATYRGQAFVRNAVSIEGSVTVEPISANPKFANIAGAPENPDSTHAIWENRNGVNTFVQFKESSIFAGIESYYAPEWTASVEWLTGNPVSTFEPGTLYALPETDTFVDPTGWEWLCTSVSQQPHGNSYRITAQLMGSPDWPAAIYST